MDPKIVSMFVLGVSLVIYTLMLVLATRFVGAHARIADALELLARRGASSERPNNAPGSLFPNKD